LFETHVHYDDHNDDDGDDDSDAYDEDDMVQAPQILSEMSEGILIIPVTTE
jgi:hypothetical protein